MFRRISPVITAILFLALSALACNAPAANTPPPSLPTAPPVATTAPVPTDTPQPQEASPTPQPPEATNTPVPDVSGEGGCTLNAAYVADVTIPDDTEISPGETFHKVWRVRNSGTCDWEEGTQLTFVSGEAMGTSSSVSVPSVAAGATVDIGVDMTAPTAPGTYRSTWQLQSPEGVFFGSQIYAQIIVPEPPTATPTATPAPSATPTLTPTTPPGPPDLVITDIHVDTATPRQRETLHIVVTLFNQGESPAENFHWAWRVCITGSCDYIEAPGTFTLNPREETTAQLEYTFEGFAQYTTEAWVDSREEIAESNEDNNFKQLVIPVQAGKPDLVIQDITLDPDPPVQGSEVAVQVIVANQGTNSTDRPFLVRWWGGVDFPTASCEWTVSSRLQVDAQETLDCTFTYNSWYGSITTRAIADVNDEIVEWDEDNNTLDKTISVARP